MKFILRTQGLEPDIGVYDFSSFYSHNSTARMEQNTTCAPDASTSHPKVLLLVLAGSGTLPCELFGGSIGPSVPLRRESPMAPPFLFS